MVTSAHGVVFDTLTNLVIDADGTPSTVLAADVTNAASTTFPHAIGTLHTVLTGTTTEIVVVAASGTGFDASTNLVLVGSAIVAAPSEKIEDIIS